MEVERVVFVVGWEQEDDDGEGSLVLVVAILVFVLSVDENREGVCTSLVSFKYSTD